MISSAAIENLQNLNLLFSDEPKNLNSLKDIQSSIVATISQISDLLKKKDNDLNMTACKLLTDLKTKIQKSSLSYKLREEIIKIESLNCLIQSQNIIKEKRPSIALEICFFSDVDAVEHNDFSGKIVADHIHKGIAFVISKANLLAINNKDKKKFYDKVQYLVYLAIHYLDNWDIFCINELLLFLPKSILGDLPLELRLKALDISPHLTPVDKNFLFQWPEKKSNLNDFFSIFTNQPSCQKVVHLVGHGNSSVIGALKDENYREFIKFLKHQNCKALLVTSCQAGGLSSLYNFPKEPENDLESFLEQINGNDMVTIINSIGDFSVYYGTPSSVSIYQPVKEFLEKDPLSLFYLKKRLANISHNLTTPWTNTPKVYFPHSPHTHEQFRPFNNSNIFSLNAHALFKSKATHAHDIIVKNKLFLAVTSLVSDVAIRFIHNDAILMSTIPGKAHHYIQSLHLDLLTPIDYILQQIVHHKAYALDSIKIFYINHLSSLESHFSHVIITLTNNGCFAYYKWKNRYYFNDGDTNTEISRFEYSLNSKISASNPYRLAYKTLAGHEIDNDNLFKSKIHEFFEFIKLTDIEKSLLLDIDHQTIVNLARTYQEINPQGFEAYIFYLIKNDQYDLAVKILEKLTFNPNMTSRNKNPLIFFSFCHQALLKLLISKGADLNITKDNGNSLLDYTLICNNKAAFNLVFHQPHFNFNLLELNNFFNSLFVNSEHDVLFYIQEILKKDKSAIDHITKNGQTLLNVAVEKMHGQVIDFLLDNGADPNLGFPCPLFTATAKSQYDLIEKFMKHGADPFRKNQRSKDIPFIEACFRAPVEVLKLMENAETVDFNIEDESGITPFLASLISNNPEKIQFLKSKKAELPLFLNNQTATLHPIVCRSFYLNHYTLIKELLLDEQTHPIFASVLNILYISEPLFFSKILEDLRLINHPVLTNICLKIASKNISFVKQILSQEIEINDTSYLVPYMNLLLTINDLNLFKKYYNTYFFNKQQTNQFLKTLLTLDLEADKRQIFKWLAHKIQLNFLEIFEHVICKNDEELLNFCVESVDNNIDTYLEIAAKNCCKDQGFSFKKLTKKRQVDLNQVNSSGLSYFDLICIHNTDPNLFTWSLQNGAHLKTYRHILLNTNDTNFIMLKTAIEIGFSLNSDKAYKTAKHDHTYLNAMILSESLQNVRWALENHAIINPSNVCITPLQLSIKLKNDPSLLIFKELIAGGANINDVGNQYSTPVILDIIKKNDLSLIKFCIKNGSKLTQLKHRQIALKNALCTATVEIVDYILSLIDIHESDYFNFENLLFWFYRFISDNKNNDDFNDLNLAYLSENTIIRFWRSLISNSKDFSVVLSNNCLRQHLEKYSNNIMDLMICYNNHFFLSFIHVNQINAGFRVTTENLKSLINADKINFIDALYKTKLINLKSFYECRFDFIYSAKVMQWLLEHGLSKDRIEKLIIENSILTKAVCKRKTNLVVYCISTFKKCIAELYQIDDYTMSTLLDEIKQKNDVEMLQILKDYI